MRWAMYLERIVRYEKMLHENIYLKAAEYAGVYWIYLAQYCDQ
jgi:hypothetical protein